MAILFIMVLILLRSKYSFPQSAKKKFSKSYFKYDKSSIINENSPDASAKIVNNFTKINYQIPYNQLDKILQHSMRMAAYALHQSTIKFILCKYFNKIYILFFSYIQQVYINRQQAIGNTRYIKKISLEGTKYALLTSDGITKFLGSCARTLAK